MGCEELTSVSLAEFDGAAAGASPSQDAEFYLLLGDILQVDGFGSKLARSIGDAIGLAARGLCWTVGQTMSWRRERPAEAGCPDHPCPVSPRYPQVLKVSTGCCSPGSTNASSDHCAAIAPRPPAKARDWATVTKLAQKRRPLTYRDVEMELDATVFAAPGRFLLGRSSSSCCATCSTILKGDQP